MILFVGVFLGNNSKKKDEQKNLPLVGDFCPK
jgi:hypothetical protein